MISKSANSPFPAGSLGGTDGMSYFSKLSLDTQCSDLKMSLIGIFGRDINGDAIGARVDASRAYNNIKR
jgi:hypothetical protein